MQSGETNKTLPTDTSTYEDDLFDIADLLIHPEETKAVIDGLVKIGDEMLTTYRKGIDKGKRHWK